MRLVFQTCIDRIIALFEPLKTFFLDEDNSQPTLNRFFGCPIAKLLLIFIRDECQIFEESIEKMEGDIVTGFTAFEIMNQLKTSAEGRLDDGFKSSAFRNELKSITDSKSIPFDFPLLKKRGNDQRITIDNDYLNAIFDQFHKDCIDYLEKWIEPLKELQIWTWAALTKIPEWKEIQACFDILLTKGFFVEGDDVKLHAEYCNLKLILQNLLPKWESQTAQYKKAEEERKAAREQQASSSTAATTNNPKQKTKQITKAQLKSMKVTTESKWIEVFAEFSKKQLSFGNIYKLVEYAMVIPGINHSINHFIKLCFKQKKNSFKYSFFFYFYIFRNKCCL